MKYLPLKDIVNLNIKKSIFLDWVKEAMLIKEKAIMPPKLSLKHWSNGFVNVMPCILPTEGVYGTKIVSRNDKTIPVLQSKIFLYNERTCELLSVMDGNFITAFRTGACAAFAIETLAVKNYKVIGLIGLGNICRATMSVLFSKVRQRKITVKLYLYKNTDNGMASFLKQFKNIKVERCKTIKETIKGSDVIVSCPTFANHDLSLPSWFKKGALLVPVHTRGFLNCDLVFDKVIVDDFGHTKTFKNFDKFNNCCELVDVIKNKKRGRISNNERIISYNVGISLLDIYFAKKIYNLLPHKSRIPAKDIKLSKIWVK